MKASSLLLFGSIVSGQGTCKTCCHSLRRVALSRHSINSPLPTTFFRPDRPDIPLHRFVFIISVS